MDKEKLIDRSRSTVALITSFTKDTEFAHTFPNLYGIFQIHAKELNDALGEHAFSWDEK
jgi:hypothetical protein